MSEPWHGEPQPNRSERENVAEYSVSELAAALKRTLEDGYGYVRVRGEISGFKRAGSGHLYFALKDESAVLDAVCWRSTAQRLKSLPEDGLEVVATGRITTYPEPLALPADRRSPGAGGHRRPDGAARGAPQEARGRGPVRGRAQAPPALPAEVIGVVTSPSGAVIRDILHRLAERFPRRVLLWPVLVQGELAAEQVAGAIEGFNALTPGGAVPRPDLLIVARGGGSLEDLWAFNEEIVVRAAAASAIPLISAVGHETDTTLIDLAADQRAPTPTAAAELAVPVRTELAVQLGQCEQRMLHGVQRELQQLGHRVVGLGRGLPDPVSLVGQASQRLDDLTERLPHSLSARIERAGLSLAEVGARLGSPARMLAEAEGRLRPCAEQLRYLFGSLLRERNGELGRLGGRLTLEEVRQRLPRHARLVDDLAARQDHAVQRGLRDASERLRGLGGMLESLSYQGVLARGFALVRDERGRLVDSAARARACTALELEFHDGRVPTLRSGARASGRTTPSDDQQERLL